MRYDLPGIISASMRTAFAAALLLGSACAAQAAENEYDFLRAGPKGNIYAQSDEGMSSTSTSGSPVAEKSNVSYPKMLWEDTKYVLTAPARWDEQEWKKAGWTALGIAGVMAVIDRPVQDGMRRIAPDNDPLTPDNSRFLHEVERFGREYSLGVLGGFYVAGALRDDGNAIAVAQDGLTSVILASGIITTVTKVAVGRARPREDKGVAHFRPFGGDQSFPSGHAAHAFAVASVIANHYDETWVTCTSYSVASLVGVARSYHGGHFVSDILAGAMIGTLVGKSVVEHNQSMRSGKVVLLPEATPGMVGVRMVSSF
ncbi:MAG: phosphatase PAP2 family protein [Nitrosomonadales bacterium]|nr:phosphatase PAP2 family protein [Nitrosomonadales bacterium]